MSAKLGLNLLGRPIGLHRAIAPRIDAQRPCPSRACPMCWAQPGDSDAAKRIVTQPGGKWCAVRIGKASNHRDLWAHAGKYNLLTKHCPFECP